MRSALNLASGSPRRRDLLQNFFKLKVCIPRVDETKRPAESARRYVRRMAVEKWHACLDQYALTKNRTPILSADTIVVRRGQVLGKPRDRADAERMLRSLSGRWHHVITAVAVGLGRDLKPQKVFVVQSTVLFRPLSLESIRHYLKSGEWKDKAGAYAIQGIALSFVAAQRGSLSNIVGLPVTESLRALAQLAAQGRSLSVK